MNRTSHYLLSQSALLDAGFSPEDAELIAWADQSVDEAQAGAVRRITAKGGRLELFPITQEYKGMAVRNIFSKSTLDHMARTIWIPFHFFSLESDLMVRPLSILEIMGMVSHFDGISIKELARNRQIHNRKFLLVLLGILLHVQQDTYSHKDFCGILDDRNNIYPWYNPRSLMTNLGHTEEAKKVDDPYAIWYRKANDKKTARINIDTWNNWLERLWIDIGNASVDIRQTMTHKLLNSCKSESELAKVLSESISDRSRARPDYSFKLNGSIDNDDKYYHFMDAAAEWLAVYNQRSA